MCPLGATTLAFPLLIIIQNRSNIGGIICAVMMQQLNQKHPDNYLLAMRILWAPIGLMIVCWTLVPESPWFHARHGNKDKALKAMRQLYGGIPGYDFEEEYGIIERTIAHEKEVLMEVPSVIHVFKGLNLVGVSISLYVLCFRNPPKPLRRANQECVRNEPSP